MKIGIFGIGAIGTVISFTLNDKIDALYFNRSRKDTLKLTFQDKILNKNIKLEADTIEFDLDWLIVCIKEYHYPNAYGSLKGLISLNTKVAVVRNGINLKEHLLKFTTSDRILECMINAPTQMTKPFGYELLSSPEIIVSESPLAIEFSKLFNNKRILFKRTNNYIYENWKKLIESSSLGAIMCIANNNVTIFKQPKYYELYKGVLEESIKVAVNSGVEVESNLLNLFLGKLDSYGPNKGSSMLTDLQNRNEIEINAKNGAILKIARNLNIDAPLNEKLVKRLHEINNKNIKSMQNKC